MIALDVYLFGEYNLAMWQLSLNFLVLKMITLSNSDPRAVEECSYLQIPIGFVASDDWL